MAVGKVKSTIRKEHNGKNSNNSEFPRTTSAEGRSAMICFSQIHYNSFFFQKKNIAPAVVQLQFSETFPWGLIGNQTLSGNFGDYCM